MFKIVETGGGAGKQLTIVPCAWEKEGTLFWPKIGADQQVLNANSKPEDSWFTMPCTLRGNLYADCPVAKDEIEKMLEEHETARNRQTQKTTHEIQFIENTNPVGNLRADTSLEVKQEIMDTNSIPEDHNGNKIQSTEKLDQILANQKLLMQTQRNFQDAIIEKLSKFETMLQIIGMETNTAEPYTQNEIALEPFLEPVDTPEDIAKLEEKLSDRTIANEFIQKFSQLYGRNFNGNGSDSCYLLVDKFFTRKFMTLCSWAGGARDKKEKLPFKIYKNVINVFFTIVYLSDNTFTLDQCESFFKGVIRNSTRRNESHRIRTSKSKRRPKNLSYKVKETQGEEEQEVLIKSLEFSGDENYDGSEPEDETPEKQFKYNE